MREISAASSPQCQFTPFNHSPYLDPHRYIRAQLLDNLYFQEHTGLQRLYADLEAKCAAVGADVLLVDNCPPYHPDYLRKLPIYKVLRINDGPMTAYDRDFAYLHAYDHILYHSPAYSRDVGMEEKLRYCGARRMDFWPLGSFDALCDPTKTEADILKEARDVDVVFVGALHLNKMPLLAAVRKSLGRRFKLYGVTSWKRNVYFNLKHGVLGWVRPLPFEGYVPLYQRAKIGINVHNRGDYTVGSYRMFDLPANGVMQISDGGPFLNAFFSVDEEIAVYKGAEELIEKIQYYLDHDKERERIALNGFRRVQRDYKIAKLLSQAGELIKRGMELRNSRND